MKKTSICEVELSVEQLNKFRNAVEQNYLFEMFIGKFQVIIQSLFYINRGCCRWKLNWLYQKQQNILGYSLEF